MSFGVELSQQNAYMVAVEANLLAFLAQLNNIELFDQLNNKFKNIIDYIAQKNFSGAVSVLDDVLRINGLTNEEKIVLKSNRWFIQEMEANHELNDSYLEDLRKAFQMTN